MIFCTKPNRFKHYLALTLVCGLPMAAMAAPATIKVDIRGAVLQPGTYQLESGARLNAAAIAGQVSSQAWFLGAALLRQSAIEEQTRLKAGIVFELQMNGVHARSRNDDALQALLDRLYNSVQAMTVTGRVHTKMDPLAQLFIQNNALLEESDRLLYPYRPSQVRVMGAVVDNCLLQHDPAMQLHDYVDACQRHDAADRDMAYVIQPDGSASQHGVAYWNLDEASVAVGAVIYVPLKERKLSPTSTGLNDDMAAMLATQYTLGGRFDE
jgi:hypothetical protein